MKTLSLILLLSIFISLSSSQTPRTLYGITSERIQNRETFVLYSLPLLTGHNSTKLLEFYQPSDEFVVTFDAASVDYAQNVLYTFIEDSGYRYFTIINLNTSTILKKVSTKSFAWVYRIFVEEPTNLVYVYGLPTPDAEEQAFGVFPSLQPENIKFIADSLPTQSVFGAFDQKNQIVYFLDGDAETPYSFSSLKIANQNFTSYDLPELAGTADYVFFDPQSGNIVILFHETDDSPSLIFLNPATINITKTKLKQQVYWNSATFDPVSRKIYGNSPDTKKNSLVVIDLNNPSYDISYIPFPLGDDIIELAI